MEEAWPPPGCWNCGGVASEEDIRRRSVLVPREAAAGGPWTRVSCPSCGAAAVVEEAPGSPPVLAPPDAAGLEVPAFAALLDGPGARAARRRAREWMLRWGPRLEKLRAARGTRRRGRGSPPPPPPPRDRPPPGGGKRRKRPAPPPVPPPGGGGREPEARLPVSPGEARAVLGVAAGATRKEIDAAFRRASRKCHPDLVAHLDEDFQRLAHGKFLRLKRAHEILAPGGGTGAPTEGVQGEGPRNGGTP